MDSLGEVGQKMRSAIKAKLIELGTGGASGYIDDELPDYVMIMVANKRSRNLMIEDLNLFLGSNTEIFVSWLHQVLQKLQEVTLPANPPPKAVRKSSKELVDSSKRDKRDKKKKSKRNDSPDMTAAPAPPSITDVFAVELIEKAKRTLENEKKNPVKKEARLVIPCPPSPPSMERELTPPIAPSFSKSTPDDDFDIPTISEIAENAVEQHMHKKELSQLQELQNKIYLAKQQLSMYSSDSGDDDCLNINKEAEEDFDREERTNRKIRNARAAICAIRIPEDKAHTLEPTSKPSVMTRLGVKPTSDSKPANIISLSAHRKTEQQIYQAPNLRKLDDRSREKSRESSLRERIGRRQDQRIEDSQRAKERARDREGRSRDVRDDRNGRKNDRHDLREMRDRSRDNKEINSRSNHDYRETSDDKFRVNVHQRIGSRVIVMPLKPHQDEDEIDVPVNSIIKVKPRPQIPTNRQASKNLLLKAVAEAQRSTATTLIAPPKIRPNLAKPADDCRYGGVRKDFSARNQIVVQLQELEEYVPEPVSTQSESESEDYKYVPKNKKVAFAKEPQVMTDDDTETDDVIFLNTNFEEDLELEPLETEKSRMSPQFVVTLEGFHKDDPVGDDDKDPTPPPVIKRRSIKDRIGVRPEWRPKNANNGEQAEELRDRIRMNDKNDSKNLQRNSDQMEKENSFYHSKPNRVSPIKFNLTDDERMSRSRSSSCEQYEAKKAVSAKQKFRPIGDTRALEEEKPKKRRHEEIMIENVKRVKKLEPSRNFDHLPALLSSVSIPETPSKRPTPKDRCKYFPICRSGESCEFYHPTKDCKLFPSCKFGDNCAYLHPMCKFDLSCTRSDCNYMHTPILAPTTPPANSGTLPPLASSIVAVQNYKTITSNPLMICKFYPKCSNTNCLFFHPRPCMFGKNCTNKLECNFWHFELPSSSKFKWISPLS